MAKSKSDIKLNKKHGGKEFVNSFHIVGLVKPVRKKDEDSESWYDVEIFDTNKTQTGKDRRVLQFIVETAFKNELKVELAGMEKEVVYLYSSTEKKSAPIAWNDRFDKSKYPNETYHLIDSEWDKTEKLSKVIKPDMWVDVKGHYEFSTFTTEEGKVFKSVKRIIDQVTPLKNGEVIITGLTKGDTFRAYDKEVDGTYLGMGKANDEGIASVKVGWLNPEGGELYITKVVNEENTTFTKLTYTNGESSPNERITIKNGTDSSVRVPKEEGVGFQYIPYVRNFKSEEFKEINSFEMQLGIKSTYQDETTLNTKINGVFLGYGKTKSVPYDVELDVYYKEAEEGKTPFATAFGRLNKYDFLVVEGIDNNRAETALIEVVESDDNPFADVSEKAVEYETVTTGTKKGLEVLRYVQGTYLKETLTEDEFTLETPSYSNNDPFANTVNAAKVTPVEISEDMLPF